MVLNRFLISILLINLSPAFAQENIADSLKTEKITDPSDLLMFSVSYTSNNANTKNYEYDRIPAILSDFYYLNKSGITTSINYTKYYKAAVNTYETEIQLGYQKEIVPKLTLETHYGRRFFKGDTTYEGLAQKNTLSLNAAYNWKLFDFQVSNSYLNGKSDNYFLDLDLSLSLDFDNVFSKNDFLLFSPTISIGFGTDYWVYQNLRPAYERIVVNYLARNNFKAYLFEYQSLSLFFPLIYNYRNVGIIVNWFYNWPSAKLNALSWEEQSGLLFSLYYTPKLK